MKCDYCKNELIPEKSFCPACGAKVSAGNKPSMNVQVDTDNDIEKIKSETLKIQYLHQLEQAKINLKSLEIEKENKSLEERRIEKECKQQERERIKEEAMKKISPNNKITFILLAVFFSYCGAHFFYIRKYMHGFVSIIVTILWIIAVNIAVNKDENNISFIPLSMIFIFIVHLNYALKIKADAEGRTLL